MSAETPTSTEEKKPETLFIRCSVVIIGIFTAANLLNLIVLVAFFLDREWGLLGGLIDAVLVFRNRNWYDLLFPLACGTLLQLAWWVFLTFCYVCGKYDQVAEKYDDLKWFDVFGFITVPSFFRFTIFPFSCAVIGYLYISIFFYLAKGGVWIWHLIF